MAALATHRQATHPPFFKNTSLKLEYIHECQYIRVSCTIIGFIITCECVVIRQSCPIIVGIYVTSYASFR